MKFKQIKLLLIHLLLFLIPTQLSYHIWPDYAFVYGFRVDYLAPSIFFTDVLLVIISTISIKENYKKIFTHIKKHGDLFIGLLLVIFANVMFSVSPYVSLFKWLKVSEVVILFYVIKNSEITSESTYKTLLYSSVFFSLVGIVQFILGKTIGLYLLGERTFSINTPGIALVDISGTQHLRAYSTFGHPNVFAGYLGIMIILAAKFRSTFRKFAQIFLAVIFLGFLLTFSLSAYIGLMVVLIIYLLNLYRFNNVILNLGLVLSLLSPLIFSKYHSLLNLLSKSFSERVELSIISGKIISKSILFGSGLNTFIINMPSIKGSSLYIWLLQPVHNTFLLLFSEIGMVGLFLIYLIFHFGLSSKNRIYQLGFVFILLTGMFDHYWVTQNQTMMTLGILLAMSTKKN